MVICKHCNTEFNNANSISRHVGVHGLTIKEYYDQYIKAEDEGKCYECGGITSFRGSVAGYLKFCSHKCHATNAETRQYRAKVATGRKQSQEQIDKRIKNTDQGKKEQNRVKTMMDNYGVLTYYSDPIGRANKISTSLKGKKHTKEHHDNITKSKIKNGTLKHSPETKDLISKKLLEIYASDDAPVTISENSGGRHKNGYCNGMFYRSSYELLFIRYCIDNNIEILSAETKEFRVRYEIDGKKHFYYPDFYLPEFNVIIEIKPESMLLDNVVQEKMSAGSLRHENYCIITEEELENLEQFFKTLK